jgi:sec-independent protein translocase protein TatA
MTLPALMLPGTGLLVWGLPGGSEMLVILLIGLLVFGGKLPEVARNIARGIGEFKKGLGELDRDVRQPVERAMRMEPPQGSVPYQPPRPPASTEEGTGDDDAGALADAGEPDRPDDPETAIQCDGEGGSPEVDPE